MGKRIYAGNRWMWMIEAEVTGVREDKITADLFMPCMTGLKAAFSGLRFRFNGVETPRGHWELLSQTEDAYQGRVAAGLQEYWIPLKHDLDAHFPKAERETQLKLAAGDSTRLVEASVAKYFPITVGSALELSENGPTVLTIQSILGPFKYSAAPDYRPFNEGMPRMSVDASGNAIGITVEGGRMNGRRLSLDRRFELIIEFNAGGEGFFSVPYRIDGLGIGKKGAYEAIVSVDCSRDIEAVGFDGAESLGKHPSCARK